MSQPYHSPETDDLDVSVIVPTYNGARTIVTCLRAVERALAGRRAELIVVDSSTDATPEIVRREFSGARLIRSETRLSAGMARNRGLDVARGRVVCFVDQDCEVPPDWVNRLSALLGDGTLAGVGGSVGIRNLHSLSGCALYFLEFLNHFPGPGDAVRNPLFLVGCNAMYRRDALADVRFPDQTLGEDVLFAQALQARGLATLYDSSIEVLHENRTGWRVFFAYNRQIGEASANYHWVLRLPWAIPFLRHPVLAFGAPLVVLPSIALNLLDSRWSYFWRFMLLLPLCFAGNLVWAAGFRRRALALQREARTLAAHRRGAAVVDAARTGDTHPSSRLKPGRPAAPGIPAG